MASLFHCFQHETNDVPHNLVACKVGQNHRVPDQRSTCTSRSTDVIPYWCPSRLCWWFPHASQPEFSNTSLLLPENVKLNAKSNTFVLSPMDRDVEQILFLWSDFWLFEAVIASFPFCLTSRTFCVSPQFDQPLIVGPLLWCNNNCHCFPYFSWSCLQKWTRFLLHAK